jgi:hypothetical protein
MEKLSNIRRKRKHGLLFLFTLAIALLIAILSLGTLAYTNFIQNATNEFIGFVNHGVRIHDDYKEIYNAYHTEKDVYVENYGDSPLLIRIRLDEFYRVGSTVLIGDAAATESDPSVGWETYKGSLTAVHEDWKWAYGGQKWYLPTENIDDSDAAADNIFERFWYDNDGAPGTAGSATTQAAVTTTATRPLSASDVDHMWTNNVFPTYDNSNNGGHTASDPYTNKTVAQTLPATVVTMADWISGGKQKGSFWVMDVDGWFYWAQTLQSGSATGQLLNAVSLENHALLDHYFYGINVVLQAATWDERTAFETGKDSVTGASNTITDNAKSLLSVASDIYAFNLTGVNAKDQGMLFTDEQGTQWRVLYVNESKKQALILREYLLDTPVTAQNFIWNSMTLKTTLNTTYLDGLGSDLKDRVVDQTTTLLTCQSTGNTVTASTGQNSVIMLSEYDVIGTAARSAEATVSGATGPFFADAASRIAYTSDGVPRQWWTRSASTTNNANASINASGVLTPVLNSVPEYVRPAMFIDLTVMPGAPVTP